jgi:hypothetical protein
MTPNHSLPRVTHKLENFSLVTTAFQVLLKSHSPRRHHNHAAPGFIFFLSERFALRLYTYVVV